MKFIKNILVIIFGIVLIGNVLASTGVTPGRTTIDFEANLEKTISFDIINSKSKDMDFILSVKGELSEYINLGMRKISISSGEDRKTFSYDLKLPSSLESGIISGTIIITQTLGNDIEDGSYVSATLVMTTQIYVDVPYPGKYAESGLVVHNTEENEDITFVFPVTNKGEFDLTNVRANVDIYNKVNEKVGSFNTDPIFISSGEKSLLAYSWDSNLSIGEYRVAATLIYDEGTIGIDRIFRIGNNEIELKKINFEDFEFDKVVELEMLIENKFDEAVNVYADVVIVDYDGNVISNFKSPNYDLDSLSEDKITVYWNTANINSGSYQVDMTIYSENKTYHKNLEFEVDENGLMIIGLEDIIFVDKNKNKNLLIIIIVIVATLIFVNLLWFFVIRKKLGGIRKK